MSRSSGKASTTPAITIKEIAKEAGVSLATVSRVLNNTRNVDKEIAAKVLAVAERYDFKPSPAARFMKGQRTGILGLIVPDVSLSFFGDLAEGAIRSARTYDQVIIVASSQGDRNTENIIIDQLSRSLLDGLIYCPVASGAPLPEIERFRDLPLVVVGRRSVFKDRPHIYTDNRKAGYIAAKYLINLGRTNIGFVAGFWDPPCNEAGLYRMSQEPTAGCYSTLDRFYGYSRALVEANISYNQEFVVVSGYDSAAGYSSAQKLLRQNPRLDSLLVPNTQTAEGALRYCKEQAISVPSEVSILSFDDGGLASMLATPLTALCHDMDHMGSRAVESLNSLIVGEEIQDTILDASLIIRDSTSAK
ncbi:MAG: LacI family DNA-binding transcriptional regulator [Spirochaetia bacterium]|jgi:LacI family transcriptional regulator|nr:LacI family DNA-binding transcriptional regulator [Spirochaetia bacterium]